MTASPTSLILIALLLAGALSICWLFLRHSLAGKMRGFEKIAPKILSIRRGLNGRLVRRHSELRIEGLHRGKRVTVVLSHADSAPELTVSMRAASSFSLVLLPRRGAQQVLPKNVSAGMDRLGNSHVAQADNLARASAFLTNANCAASLGKLLRNSQQIFSLDPSGIHFSQAILPEHLSEYVFSSLEPLSLIVSSAEDRKLLKAPGHQLGGLGIFVKLRTAVAVSPLVVAVAIGAIVALRSTPAPAAAIHDPAGLPVTSGWRVATPADFASQFANVGTDGVLQLDVDDSGNPEERAAVLIGQDGSRRLLIMSGYRVCYDSLYRRLDGIARISKEQLPLLAWPSGDAPPAGTVRDGLLVVTNSAEPNTDKVFLTEDCKIHVGEADSTSGGTLRRVAQPQ